MYCWGLNCMIDLIINWIISLIQKRKANKKSNNDSTITNIDNIQKGEENMLEFKIDGVPYYTQRDNKRYPHISCFPTSLAMVMKYCLKQKGLTKADVGCAPEYQLEDYIDMLIDDDETKAWMLKNEGRLGSWIWKYRRRTIYAVEAYIFNRLMNRHGYEALARYDFNYQAICNILRETGLPMVIGGNFSSVSRVKGHMNTLIGYNAIGLKEFIVHDPYGIATTGYTNHNGESVRYSSKFFKRDGDKIFCVYVKTI